MTIDFNDKLRSTRRDHKLIDADAIDGVTSRVWRPFFFVIENVGPSGVAYSPVQRGHV